MRMNFDDDNFDGFQLTLEDGVTLKDYRADGDSKNPQLDLTKNRGRIIGMEV